MSEVGTGPPDVARETLDAYLTRAPQADGWHLLDNMKPDELREFAKIAIRRLRVTPCRYGDATCPCQDGDSCHYEGPDAMEPPSEIDRLAAALVNVWRGDETDEQAYDAACADLLGIPDGWAKSAGKWFFVPEEHVVEFGPARWGLEHPLSCRVAGSLIDCPYNTAVGLAGADGISTDTFGRWRVTGIDSDGLPVLEHP